jgi:glutamate--cysteine ligase
MRKPRREMVPTTSQRIHPLNDFHWGIERETHRVLPDGALSPAPHPPTLQQPGFTRDFAESQLEIVTPPRSGIRETLAELGRLTEAAQREIGDELLWPFSMPPRLPEESEVPIASFGPTEAGRRARLYREGLALRYGKARQMICGVHVNVSAGAALLALMSSEAPLTSEERKAGQPADAYALRLIRNLYAELPLLILLYGASPVLGGGEENAPPAISYRNSRGGYARDEFMPYLDLTTLGAYLDGIRRGLRTQSPIFAGLGLVRGGRVVQLNTNVFQTDKEFYAPIRLRQTLLGGESALDALARRGVGYLELRFFDVDPTHPSGIAQDALRLLHLLLLDALARPSTPRTNATLRRDLAAATDVALRDPRTLAAEPLLAAADLRLAALSSWAERLEAAWPTGAYRASLALFRRRVAHPSTLPSAKLAQAFAASGLDWTAFGVRTSRALKPQAQGVEHALEYAGV